LIYRKVQSSLLKLRLTGKRRLDPYLFLGGFIFSNPEQYLYLDQVLIKIHLITRGVAMKQNIHNVERIIRVVVGLIVFSLVFVGPKSLWGLIGILPIMTGLIGWCPPYQLLGISTCKK
jgi:hypothetical protein